MDDSSQAAKKEAVALEAAWEVKLTAANAAAAAAGRKLEEEQRRSAAEMKKVLDDLDERMRLLKSREAQLTSTVAKVMRAEEAMEACLTCMSCMELLAEPLTCSPCGHTFCAKCLADAGGRCQECDEAENEPLQVKMLGTLVSKFNFQRQALSTLSTSALVVA